MGAYDGRVLRTLTSTTRVSCTYESGVEGVTVDQLRQMVAALGGVPGDATVMVRIGGMNEDDRKPALVVEVAHNIPERLDAGAVY
ncbi:hypothetical protein [Gordonia sp. UCD-TK1]|uniref:hypothetical protein n=1 Tax=Gordonia sp. UCD-TK1 TaxID=1857893 RepID=UPI00080E9621|nr:hypothetical protein [Gordonia sp. UCD-TK1]OCH81789.1 hypothetical protein A9310_04150 [Gordonia sp. UCD-TK1]